MTSAHGVTTSDIQPSRSSATLTVDIPPPCKEEAVVPAPISADNAVDKGYDEKDTHDEGKPSAVEMIDGRPRDIYDRFTKSQKNRIVAIVSYSAFLSRKPTDAAAVKDVTLIDDVSRRIIRLPPLHPPTGLRTPLNRLRDRLHRSNLHTHHRDRSSSLVTSLRVLR